MKEIGREGQERLAEGRVLIIGCGGLGSPVAMYLAAAGVGTIGLMDGDVVDETNLQRQVIHFTADVGKPKVTSAADKLRAINPHIRIIEIPEFFTAEVPQKSPKPPFLIYPPDCSWGCRPATVRRRRCSDSRHDRGRR